MKPIPCVKCYFLTMWQKYLLNKDLTESVQSRRQKQSNLQLVKAQGEVQDLGKLLRQRLFPLQVLGRVTVRLAGQSTQQAVQRRFCQREIHLKTFILTKNNQEKVLKQVV